MSNHPIEKKAPKAQMLPKVSKKSNDHGKILRFSDMIKEPQVMLLPIEGYQNMPIVSLERAVEALEIWIPNVVRNAWIAIERVTESLEGLSKNESAAIQLYTMEWSSLQDSFYVRLNAALRSEARDLLVPYFSYLKLMLTALFKLPVVRKTVWRGVKADLSYQYPTGSTFVWWGFSSCTESIELLESEKFLGKTGIRTLFSIECESGRAIYKHSYYKDENEILLLPATSFKVLGIINPSPELHIIHIKEIKPRFPLLENPLGKQ